MKHLIKVTKHQGCILTASVDKIASLVAQLVKNPPVMQDTWVQSPGWEDPQEKGKATHSHSGLENSRTLDCKESDTIE